MILERLKTSPFNISIVFLIGIPNKLGFESIKESAIYDNCINEAKLARVHRGKFLDENPSATSVIHQILNKLTELAINGEAQRLLSKVLIA